MKKSTIRLEPFSKHVGDQNFCQESWRILEKVIDEIYNQNASGIKFEEHYRTAYKMVLYKFGKQQYSWLVTSLASHITQVVRSIEATQKSSFLEELNEKWNNHTTALKSIKEIFQYLDKSYVKSYNKAPVFDLGIDLWREFAIYSPPIRTRLVPMLLELVCSERSGKVIDRGLFCKLTKMLTELGPSVYGQEFETPFLKASVDFYKVESQNLIESCDSVYYIKKAESRLNEEIARVSHYLVPDTKDKITNVVEKEMIENNMLTLIHMENSGLVKILSDDKYEDLSRMYNIFCRVPDGVSKILEVMTSHIKESGKQVATDMELSKNPVDFVQRLLDMKDKYDKILEMAFNNGMLFINALNSSFEFFINLNPRSPEFISLFVDHKLRKGQMEIGEDDIEIPLNKAMMLFRHLQEKDVFERYYKQHLAKRLLSGKTVSDDAERIFILKLQTECGCPYTCNMENMLKDMKISLDTMEGFYKSHPELKGDGCTLNVQVLATGSWPTQTIVRCNLPAEISALCEKFRAYYIGKHSGRKLSWQNKMGTADLKVTFGKGQKHELDVSTYQMCVLMLFNNADRLSYKEIEQATEIPAPDLKRCLQALALVRGKNVLRKDPMSKDVAEDDAFFVNDEFSSKRYRVKIGTIASQKESEPKKQETRQRVEEERKPQIEATIVRIMKSRNVLDHNELMAEVTKQLQSRFLANPVEVKKRIEALIERDFLERDINDRRLYRYLA